MSSYLTAEEIDQRWRWGLGTAARLARKGRLPHRVLPDGSLRFEWAEIEPLVRRVPAAPALALAPGGARDARA